MEEAKATYRGYVTFYQIISIIIYYYGKNDFT